MLKEINLIRNIGCFDSFSGLSDLKKLVLIYAENGRGKTTLSAILSSLANNDANILMARKRLGASHQPHVILSIEDANAATIFRDNTWNHPFEPIFIYDDEYVSRNVYSGLEITANHRQSLHEVILGHRGVSLARRVDELAQKISECNRIIRETSDEITSDKSFGLDIDAFSSLPQIEGIEHAVKEKQKEYDAVCQSDTISNKPLFSQISFPVINIEALRDILSRELSDLNETAVQGVRKHFSLIGDKAEEWISDGMDRIISEGEGLERCPFCGQNISPLDLIDMYRAYFGQAYIALNRDIELHISQYATDFSGDQLSSKQEDVNKVIDLHRFWQTFLELREIDIKWADISTTWQEARDEILSLLTTKKSSPLNTVDLTGDAKQKIERYISIISGVQEQIQSLINLNQKMSEIKASADSSNLQDVRNQLNRLKATQSRHSDELKRWCDIYLSAVSKKADLESEKEIARVELDNHRQTVFSQYHDSINTHLELFGANFRIGALQSSNAAGLPSTTYHLIVNDHEVPLAIQGNRLDLPCFKNTLSAGDRNTLALSFFFASLENEPDLENSIIVLDDPISSLDDGRTTTTIQKIRSLLSLTKQVIVLCHLTAFLCDIWEHSDKNNTTALKISRRLNSTSDIVPWDVSSDAFTEYDKRHKILRDYVNEDTGDKRYVAQCLRPVMEKYLRITFPEHCMPGTSLGQFENHVKNLLENGQRITSDVDFRELRDIREYANKFHHDTNPAWQTEQINDNELLGFVKRVLNFVKHGTT
ncbi:MAG TPA: AAA family ATPase [Sedimentisphaerales bacterium]|nr:AAA family ATPase [Sedimentisphaerales bacterium]